jgi:WD40 repeat protein
VPRVSWSFKAKGAVWGLAVSRDGSVAAGFGPTSDPRAGDLKGELVALSPGGQPLWRLPSKSGVACVRVPSDGSFIIAVFDGEVQKFSREGTPLWKHSMDEIIDGVAMDGKGSLIVASSRTCLDGLSPSGERLWSKKAEGCFWELAMPFSGEPLLVTSWVWPPGTPVGKLRGTIAALDVRGNELWRHIVTLHGECNDDVHLAPAASSDASVAVLGSSALEGRLVVLDRQGRVIWRDQTRGEVVSAAIAADGSVIALGEDTLDVQVFDGPRGKSWRRRTGGDPAHTRIFNFGLAIAPDGSFVAAGIGDDNLYLFDRDGALVLKEPLGEPLQSAAFSEDGSALVVGSYGGTVKAIRLC